MAIMLYIYRMSCIVLFSHVVKNSIQLYLFLGKLGRHYRSNRGVATLSLSLECYMWKGIYRYRRSIFVVLQLSHIVVTTEEGLGHFSQ